MTKILAVTNQKGGVGKTTSSVNIADSLASLNKKTLLIDLDPQANASKRLQAATKSPNINDALLGGKNEASAEDLIYPACAGDQVIPNLYILPASSDRELATTAEVMTARKMREQILARYMKKNRDIFKEFDYIIIDTNPSLSVLTLNAMMVSDALIIPVTTSKDSHDSALQALDTMMELHDFEDRNEIDYRVLRCMINRASPRMMALAERLANKHRKDKQFSQLVSKNVEFENSEAVNQPVRQLFPKGRGTEEYTLIAKEIING